MNRKIAIVITSLGAGGAERVAVNQANYLAKIGNKISLITLTGGAEDHYLADEGVKRVRFSTDDPPSLIMYIKEMNFELVVDHIHWSEHHYHFFELLAEHATKFIIFDHSVYFYPLLFDWRYSMFNRRAEVYQLANATTALTKHTCALFRHKVPQSVLMHNPLSYESDTLSKLDNKNIVVVANWERKEKRVDRVFDIFKRVLDVEPSARLTFVGSYVETEVMLCLKKFGVPSDTVTFVGRQEDVSQYYINSRVFLLTSEIEGFGLVLTEAAMHGLPRVAMHVSGLEDIIKDGSDGFMLEQDDLAGVAERLITLLGDDRLTKKMGNCARENSNKFKMDNIGKRWEWLIEVVLNSTTQDDINKSIYEDSKSIGVLDKSMAVMCDDYDRQILSLLEKVQRAKDAAIGASATEDMCKAQFKKAIADCVENKIVKWLLRRLIRVDELMQLQKEAVILNGSELFDRQWYLEKNPDVAAEKMDPVKHYLQHGAKELRDPSPKFSTRVYLDSTSTINNVDMNPLIHFLSRREESKVVSAAPPKNVKYGREYKHSWSPRDTEWMKVFSKNRGPVTLLEPNWLGIRKSASQFEPLERTLFINDDLNDIAAHYFASMLIEAGVQKIVIQGFPLSYSKLVNYLNELSSGIEIFCMYHGTFAAQRLDYERESLRNIIHFCNAGLIKQAGFVKDGMADTFKSLGVNAQFVMNFINKIPNEASVVASRSIGIVGSEWNEIKPLYHQIAACKHLSYDELHIVGAEKYAYDFLNLLDMQATCYKSIAQEGMPEFLSKNLINLYVTLSDCAAMVPLESLSEGVPCLFGPGSHYFKDHLYLRDRLVVAEPDSEKSIANKALVAIDERTKIIDAYKKYAVDYNLRAMQSYKSFIGE